MIYVGVDIAKANHCLGAIDAQGGVVQKPVRFTQDAAGWAELAAILQRLGGPGAVTIGFEATGHYWVLLAEELVRLGYQPQVFNPIWRAAFIACKHPAFADIYHKHRVTMKQHQKIALSHVARKIVQAIYGVLRYQKPFDIDAFRHGVKPAEAA